MKGRQRRGEPVAWRQQPAMLLREQCPGPLCGQAVKKIHEATRGLSAQAQVTELLGAITYLGPEGPATAEAGGLPLYDRVIEAVGAECVSAG